MYNVRAEPVFCLLKLLFSDVFVDVVVVAAQGPELLSVNTKTCLNFALFITPVCRKFPMSWQIWRKDMSSSVNGTVTIVKEEGGETGAEV